ncbi:MAG: alpha/beta hydrolase [Candidatus Woesearchaeota archaeon]
MVLITHSSSTQLGLEYLKYKPKKLKKIVLISASVKDSDPVYLKLILLLPRIILYSLYRTFLLNHEEKVYQQILFSKKTKKLKIKRFVEENNIPRLETFLIYKTYWNFNSLSWVKDFKKPALIITGEDDVLVPKSKDEELAKAMPKSELYVIKEAGHMCFYEKPNLVNKRMERFLK